MPLHEVSFQGLLLSPIFTMVLIAAALTIVTSRVVDRIIPYSMQRNESLLGMLLFMLILAGLVRITF
jgi:predicted PurR-regulated permease PerM